MFQHGWPLSPVRYPFANNLLGVPDKKGQSLLTLCLMSSM